MGENIKIPISKLISDLNLDIVYKPENREYFVEEQDVNRAGLALTGYMKYFSYERIQVIGMGEYNYFKNIDKETRAKILDEMFSYEIPALIVARGLKIDDDILEAAKKHERIILSSKKNTTKLINKLYNYLDNKLAPQVTIHGVLVDVYGIGVLIKGESSIGKSETALELIQRGHRLVADDAIEIIKLDDNRLVGQAPEILRHYMEIRGIGIIDVRSLYGVGAIKNVKQINIILQLEGWNQDKHYDRLGLDKEYDIILGQKIEKLVVPVKPGRNTAMIVEVAAMNYRQKAMGYDAAVEFTHKLAKTIDQR